MRLLAAASAIFASLIATPSSAAFITYSVEAGGDKGGTHYSSELLCGPQGCQYVYEQEDTRFSMSGTFVVDPTKVGPNRITPTGILYVSGGFTGVESFVVSSDVTINDSFGPAPVPQTNGGVRDRFRASENLSQPGTGLFELETYSVYSDSRSEYDASGVLRRFTSEFMTNSLRTGNVADISMVDGVEIPILVGAFSQSGPTSLLSFSLFEERLWDETGAFVSFVRRINRAEGFVSAISVNGIRIDEPEPHGRVEVPEPESLLLLGFGTLALASRRRRRG